jgi:RNA polymerase sigma factor (sigma-70 family)
MTPLVELIRRYLAAEPYRRLPDDDLWAKFAGPRDDQALCALLERCGARIFARCRTVLGDEHLAEEAFQETFCELYRRRARLPSYRAAVAWLYQTATNQARKARRRHWRAVRRDRARAAATPERVSGGAEAGVVEREEVTAVLAALAGLPAKQRRALELVYQEGLTHEEAAAALGWSRGAVGVYVARGLERLRAALSRRGLLTAAGGAVAVESALTARVPALTVERAATLAGGVLARTEEDPARTLAGLVFGRWKVAAVVGLAAGFAIAGAAWRPWEPAPPGVPRVPDPEPEPAPTETLQAKNLRVFRSEVLPKALAELQKLVPPGTELQVTNVWAVGSEVLAEIRPPRPNAGLFPARLQLGYCVLRRLPLMRARVTEGSDWIGFDPNRPVTLRLYVALPQVTELRVGAFYQEADAILRALESLPADERAEREEVERLFGPGGFTGGELTIPGECSGVAGNSRNLFTCVRDSVFVRGRVGGWRYWGEFAGRLLAADETHLYAVREANTVWSRQIKDPAAARVLVAREKPQLRFRFLAAGGDLLWASTESVNSDSRHLLCRSTSDPPSTDWWIADRGVLGLTAARGQALVLHNGRLSRRPIGPRGTPWELAGPAPPGDNGFLAVWGDRLVHVPNPVDRRDSRIVSRPLAAGPDVPWRVIGRIHFSEDR